MLDPENIARAIHEARCGDSQNMIGFDDLDGCEHGSYLDALRRDAEAAAKRITSAVEPSGVVTDEMVEAHALAAALSSRTEQEVVSETIEALATMFERGMLTEENSIQGDVPRVIRAQDSASLALLRSLTNGGE